MQHVHQGCLAEWQGSPPTREHCEICRARLNASCGATGLLAGSVRIAWRVLSLAAPAALLALGAWQGARLLRRASNLPKQQQRERRARQKRQRQRRAQQLREEQQRWKERQRVKEWNQEMDAVRNGKAAWAVLQVLRAAGRAGRRPRR